MNRILKSKKDVLIVGAGPTGLVLASELLRRGVRCRVIDKQDSYPTSTRGHALQPQTLEILDHMGIADKMLAVGTTAWKTKFFRGSQLVFELDTSIGQRPGKPDVHVTNATWFSNYSINRRMVNHYRRGRAFVAGDAAHIHSPSGGQGMNTGIQEEHDEKERFMCQQSFEFGFVAVVHFVRISIRPV
jgi:2-polyprenyl-6-methoxyphenol hydroxylase-like FAD-dependent oxidoreductase